MILVLLRVSRPIRYLKNYRPIRYLNLFSKFPFTPSLYHLETYPERYQSSRLKLFAEIVSSFQVLTFFAKSSILDIFSRLWIRFSHISSNTGTVLWGNYMVFNFLACLISLLSVSLFYRITKLNIGAFAGTNIVILNKSNSSWTSFFNYDCLHYHPNPICSTLNLKLYL